MMKLFVLDKKNVSEVIQDRGRRKSQHKYLDDSDNKGLSKLQPAAVRSSGTHRAIWSVGSMGRPPRC